MKSIIPVFCLASVLTVSTALVAAVVGTNPPSQPLTTERIASLPANEQPAWAAYLEKSKSQMHTDRAFLANELKAHDLKETSEAPSGHDAKSVPINHPITWYSQPEATKIADIVVSFQTAAGGWSKNIDLSQHVRKPGERYSHDGGNRFMSDTDNDKPADMTWSYIGTYDNDATITELEFLAKYITANSSPANSSYRTAFDHGLKYILDSQYPNGGWPQVWPLEGGYHDAITFNDGASLHILALQHEVAEGKDEYAFVPSKQRALAEISYKKGLACLLACQVTTNGHKTVWGQQNDMITLAPSSARNYEMPSQASSESADIVLFLMELKKPSPAVKEAIKSAVAWFNQTAIHGYVYKSANGDRRLVSSTTGGSLWARYHEIGTDRPLFGDRDKSVHDKLEEISSERRNGYQWYNGRGQEVLEKYKTWQTENS